MIEGFPDNGPTDWRYHEGIPLAGEFPSGATLQFSRGYPDRRELRDFLPNPLSALIISSRVRVLLEGRKAVGCEFLPVRILDHAGAVAAEGYSILNLQGGLPVIDLKRSGHTMGALDKTQIDDITNLIVDPTAVTDGHLIFRASMMRRLFLIQDELKSTFDDVGVTGWRTWPADGWDGMYL